MFCVPGCRPQPDFSKKQISETAGRTLPPKADGANSYWARHNATSRILSPNLLPIQTILYCRRLRSERLAKYNQLLRIEEELGDSAVYAGKDWRFIPWSKAD